MSWSRRRRKALRFSRQDWAALLAGWRALLWALWQLRRHPLPTVLAHVQAESRHPVPATPTEPLVRGVQRAARLFPVPVLCLPQSVAVARLLVQRGQPCSFLLGAQPKGDTLDAHAWVEVAGEPINSAPNTALHHPVLLHHALGAPASTLTVG